MARWKKLKKSIVKKLKGHPYKSKAEREAYEKAYEKARLKRMEKLGRKAGLGKKSSGGIMGHLERFGEASLEALSESQGDLFGTPARNKQKRKKKGRRRIGDKEWWW